MKRLITNQRANQNVEQDLFYEIDTNLQTKLQGEVQREPRYEPRVEIKVEKMTSNRNLIKSHSNKNTIGRKYKESMKKTRYKKNYV